MTYRTILVHLNDKRRAEALLEPTIALARQHNARIRVQIDVAVSTTPT